MKTRPTTLITLTEEQKKQIREASGKDVRVLRVEALESRLAPNGYTN